MKTRNVSSNAMKFVFTVEEKNEESQSKSNNSTQNEDIQKFEEKLESHFEDLGNGIFSTLDSLYDDLIEQEEKN